MTKGEDSQAKDQTETQVDYSQEVKGLKPTAPEKHPDVSPQPEYESIEEQLACFQFIGNIFKR